MTPSTNPLLKGRGLRCLNHLETLDDGQILLAGRDISDPRVDVDAVRARVGIAFQAFNQFPHLSVLDNVTLAPIRVHGRAKPEARREALDPELVGKVLALLCDLRSDGMTMMVATREFLGSLHLN